MVSCVEVQSREVVTRNWTLKQCEGKRKSKDSTNNNWEVKLGSASHLDNKHI